MTDRTLFLGAVITGGFTSLVLVLALLFSSSWVTPFVALLPLGAFWAARDDYGLQAGNQEKTAGGVRNRRTTTSERN